MSLRWYRKPRLVVLDQSDTVLEAARAIESNNIGAVVVQHRGRVEGIVTDRDLAIRALGHALDPETTVLASVMSTNVATLTLADTPGDAIRLMQERSCRRIPIVDDGHVVGMVTLDDLILDEAAPIDELAAIVQAQIGEGGPAPSSRAPARRRSLARAQATYARLLAIVRAKTGLASTMETEAALEVFLSCIVRRLSPGEAKDFLAQLPSLLQPKFKALPPGPDKSITREVIEAEMARRLNVDEERAADLVTTVGEALAERVSEGEMEDVRRQLPAQLRSIFPPDRMPSGRSLRARDSTAAHRRR